MEITHTFVVTEERTETIQGTNFFYQPKYGVPQYIKVLNESPVSLMIVSDDERHPLIRVIDFVPDGLHAQEAGASLEVCIDEDVRDAYRTALSLIEEKLIASDEREREHDEDNS